MVDVFTDQQICNYKDVFDKFDKNGDGNIQYRELGEVLVSLGIPPTDSEKHSIMMTFDYDADYQIDFPEFLTMMSKILVPTPPPEPSLFEQFMAFDTDRSGFISADELRQVLNKTGNNFTEEQLDTMLKDVDDDGDGNINFLEFIKLKCMDK